MTGQADHIHGDRQSSGEIAAEFRLQHRLGDPEIHRRLIEAYGGCAISRIAIPEILQVVPINTASIPGANDIGNLLLLRADLHNLFDSRLISVDSISLQVVVAPPLRGTIYEDFDGVKLYQPERASWRPSRQAIDAHYRQFRRLWYPDATDDTTKRLKLRRIAQQEPVSLSEPTRAQEDAPTPEPITPPTQVALPHPRPALSIMVKSWVNSVHFSPDAQSLATGSWDGSVRIWRASDGYLLHTMPSGMGEINGVCFSPDGQLLATASRNRAIQVWRTSDGALLRTLADFEEGHQGAVFNVVFSPRGDVIASGSWDQTARLWRVSDGSLVTALRGHTGAVNSVAFSPDGRYLATGSHDQHTRIWRVSDGTPLHALAGHTDAVFSVAFSPDGQYLATGSSDQTVRIWKVSDGTLLRTCTGHTGAIFSVIFSPDNHTLVSGDYNRSLRFWRVSDGTQISNLEAHSEGITCLAFNHNGTLLSSGSFDASVRLWRMTSG